MCDVVKSTRVILYGALLAMFVQAAAPALQALHATEHASEHAAVDAVAAASLDDLAITALRSEAPPSPHDGDHPSEISCKVCKGHARLGSVLPTTQVQTLDIVETCAAPATVEERVPGLVSRLDSRPRAPPFLAS